LNEIEKEIDRSGFACAIRAKQTKDISFIYSKAGWLQCFFALIRFAKLFCF
jgi:hypothetical protein